MPVAFASQSFVDARPPPSARARRGQRTSYYSASRTSVAQFRHCRLYGANGCIVCAGGGAIVNGNLARVDQRQLLTANRIVLDA